MARKGREVSKTGIYHILLRGVNSLFIKEEDYETFLSILKQKSNGVTVISYALLKNRIHIIIDAKGKDIGLVLKPIGTSYARYCNRTRASRGKLFYDRFKSEAISSKEELFEAVAFLNFIAKGQKDSEFSSLYKPLCKPSDCGLTAKQAETAQVTRLFIEDYDCLTKTELANYIYALCGVYPKDFKAQTAETQNEILEKLATRGKFSKSKIYEILNIKKPQQERKKVETLEKAEVTAVEEKPKKKDLSVWLL